MRFGIVFLILLTCLQAQTWKSHKVQSGENLTKIANHYNVSIGDLAKWNHLSSFNQIYVGQKLKILEAKTLRFSNPFKKARLLRGFNPFGDNKNLGILLRAPHSKFRPAAEGRIAKISHLRGYGNYILVDHGQGWMTMYSNLKQIYVVQGDKVQRNRYIGSANKGQLLFVVSYKGHPVNPVEVMHL